jgi:EAL and modified HD-GYP domain-containing signal transduction protein
VLLQPPRHDHFSLATIAVWPHSTIEGSEMTALRPGRPVVGRRSVHDRELAVVGYALRFATPEFAGRDGGSSQVPEEHSAVDWDEVGAGWHALVGAKRLFCRADAALLADATPRLPPAQTVIAVRAEHAGDEDVLASCGRLSGEGFTIAVADLPSGDGDGAEGLLEIATIASIDIQAVTGNARGELIEQCRERGVQVLAHSVETDQELHDLLGRGVDLFQGSALEQPRLEAGRLIEARDLTALRAAAGVLGQVLDFDTIEEVLRGEPALTYQVLRLASLGRRGETRRRVTSVRDALILAGSWRIHSWIALLLARQSGGAADEQVTAALARASTCEALAADKLDRGTARMAFTAGMLSSFDRLLQMSREQLADALPLSDELRYAAFGDHTPLGRIVCDVAEYQDGRRFPRRLSGLSERELDDASAGGFAWAVEATAVLA